MTWWDAVDVISSPGYYSADDWDAQLDRIDEVVLREGKPLFFIDLGGWLLWDRKARLYSLRGAAADGEYAPFGKFAERTVVTRYGRDARRSVSRFLPKRRRAPRPTCRALRRRVPRAGERR